MSMAGSVVSDYFRRISNNQGAISDFMPKLKQHVTPSIVNMDGGKLLMCYRLEGAPFDSVNDGVLINRFYGLKTLLASLGKNHSANLAIWTHICRRRIDFDREYDFRCDFCKQFGEKYLRRFETGDYYKNEFYFTVILKCEGPMQDGIDAMTDMQSMLESALDPYSPTLLTAYQSEGGALFSEVYEFFGRLVNGVHEQQPLTAMPAYHTIGTADLHFGSDMLEIRNGAKTKFAVCYDLKDFGLAKVKVFTPILKLPFEYTLTQSLVYVTTADMQHRIDKQLNNLISSGDMASHQHSELMEGKGHLAAGELMFGDYSCVLVVYGANPKATAANGGHAVSCLLNSGGHRFVRANLSAPFSYFSQVPGASTRPRTMPKTTENLALTFGLQNYSQGKEKGNPIGDGSAIIPLQTLSNTIYDFNFHFSKLDDDNRGEKIAGHTLILGATGTGKTTLQTALVSFAERFDPYIYAIDQDFGMEIWIRALGGHYYSLEAGKPTGLNPFQLPDTEANREFLCQLVEECGKDKSGSLTAEEKKQIKMGVDTLYQMDHGKRNFSAFIECIPPDREDRNSLRERLASWCQVGDTVGQYAWALDNPNDMYDPSGFVRVGFDVSEILREGYPPTAPILMYLFHMREIMMEKVNLKGGILCSIIEEFWLPAKYKATQELMLKMLKTDRKMGGWVVLVSQSPEDAIQCPIMAAIIQQTPTKIFLPNPDARYEGSYELCGLTPKEFEELSRLPLESRTFLVKQSTQSAFAKLDLFGMKDEMVVLSGSRENVELMRTAIKETGSEDYAVWMPALKAKIAERKKRKSELLAL